MMDKNNQGRNDRLTVRKPVAKLACFARIHVAFLEIIDKVHDYFVHMRFHSENARDRVVAHDGTFHPRVLDVVHLAEQVVLDLAVDDQAAVFGKVCLWQVSKT